jgi:hypothetical protein
VDTVVDFNRVNDRAVRNMQANDLRIVREFTEEQRLATQAAITDGIRRGANPRQQAQAFRDSIGLTRAQEQIVRNYRRNLETGSSDALGRRLRDRRQDGVVSRAIESGKPLPKAKIDTLVDNYHDRWIKYRAETVARTEALRSVNAGNHEAFRQAVDAGDIDGGQLERRWLHSNRGKDPRDYHESMTTQVRGLTEPFESGLGNMLMYPGDSTAPVEEVANCRCRVVTRVRPGRARRAA